MSLGQGFEEDGDRAKQDALERRAAALINPASGLANDFLNVYNEILMLIEMLPEAPELADDVFAWRPCSYRAYFMQSELPGSNEALDAYARLEPAFRMLFETSVELLAECGIAATRAIEKAIASGDQAQSELLADLCADWCLNIRRQLEATEQLITLGRAAARYDRQAMVDVVFNAA
ncbi:MAG: hypothetical protein KGM42_11105 [Hyphomicrobiales bacterium]|nr:hypothetical protein [Hyphomicrobiales bacterium]